MAAVTTTARVFAPTLRGPVIVPARPRPTRRSVGRVIPAARDVPALLIATTTILLERASSATGRSVTYLATLAAVVIVAAATGFAGVLVARGSIHVPGERTISSLGARVALFWQDPATAYVPAPTGVSPLPSQRALPPLTPVPTPGARAAVAPPTSDSPQPLPIPPATPVPDLPPPPATARLKSVAHVWQTWNNCGPATVTMALSAIGRAETLAGAVAVLKTSADDKNVNPDELVEYARSRGARTEWRTGGDLVTLKRLLAASVPVIVEVGFEPHPGDWMGHYRLLVGYDDRSERFVAYDSYLGPGQNVPQPYGPFDADWRAFNRSFMPVYLPSQADAVIAILGSAGDPGQWNRALARAVADAEMNPENAHAWFNVGTSLVKLERMEEAASAFDEARRLKLPWRMLWYQFGPFEAYLATGRNEDVLALASGTLTRSNDLEEIQYYKGRALHALGRPAEARSAFAAAIRANQRFSPAHHYLSLIP